MRVEAMRRFRDLQAGCARKQGEVFETSEKRLEELNGTRFGQLVKPLARPETNPVESIAAAKGVEFPEQGMRSEEWHH